MVNAAISGEVNCPVEFSVRGLSLVRRSMELHSIGGSMRELSSLRLTETRQLRPTSRHKGIDREHRERIPG